MSHVWVKTKRKSLTVPEQKAFMNYLYSNHQYQGWKPVITVLIGSGMRIGECLGLRWEDLDFENRIIDINHSLVHRKVDDSGTNFHINTPKTEAGCRRIPMIGEVYDAFLEEYQIQQITGFCTQEIDGYSGFVFASSGEHGIRILALSDYDLLHEENKAHYFIINYSNLNVEKIEHAFGVIETILKEETVKQ